MNLYDNIMCKQNITVKLLQTLKITLWRQQTLIKHVHLFKWQGYMCFEQWQEIMTFNILNNSFEPLMLFPKTCIFIIIMSNNCIRWGSILASFIKNYFHALCNICNLIKLYLLLLQSRGQILASGNLSNYLTASDGRNQSPRLSYLTFQASLCCRTDLDNYNHNLVVLL